MKKYTYLLLSAALLFVSYGCSSSDDIFNEPETGDVNTHILVEASIAGMESRVSADDAGNQSFESGDAFGMTVWDLTGSAGFKVYAPADFMYNNIKNTLGTDDKWTPAQDIFWKDTIADHAIVGIYPHADYKYTETTLGEQAITLPYVYEKQADPAFDYISANDFLGACVHSKNLGSPVKLEFEHLMSKLVVNVRIADKSASAANVRGAVVKANVDNQLTLCAYESVPFIDLSSSSSSELVNVVLRTNITPKDGYDKAFCALMVPQHLQDSQIGVGIDNAAGGTDMFTCSIEELGLWSNNCTVVNLSLYENYIVLDGITIKPWNEVRLEIDGDKEETPSVDAVAHKIYCSCGTLKLEDIQKALDGGRTLAIEGIINASDIMVLRQAASLIDSLDLSAANILGGGSFSYTKADGTHEEISVRGNVIPSYMFADMPLKSLVIPSSAVSISTNAFVGCSSLSDLQFPKNCSLEAIGNKALNGLTKVKNIVLPEGLQTFVCSAFGITDEVESITLPKTVTMTYDHYVPNSLTAANTLKTVKLLSRKSPLNKLNMYPVNPGVTLYLHKSMLPDMFVKDGVKIWMYVPNPEKGQCNWKDIIFVDDNGEVLNPQPVINNPIY